MNNCLNYKAELHLLNSLLGSKTIEDDFVALIEKYPDTLKVIPILIAVRSHEVPIYEVGEIPNFKFVWVTDGAGWKSARNNLKETFEVMETIYNLHDLEDGAFRELFD